MPDARKELWTVRLGLIDYDEALALQHEVHAARVRGDIPDMLLTLEHPPIYTKGRRSTPDELPMGEDWYRAQGIELRDVDRGGKVTYHGPGQLVAYPIVNTQIFGGDVPALVGAIERRDDRRARRRGHRRAPRRRRSRRLGGRGSGGRQDRIGRTAHRAGRHHPRPDGQRRQRSPAVQLDHARAASTTPATSISKIRRRSATAALLREARRLRDGRALRPAPADRLAARQLEERVHDLVLSS